MTIQGKVAGVINARELTVNIGEKEGVKRGMKFKILASEPLDVRDPETNETLGTLDREKVRVKATEVFDDFSVCKTYRTRTVGGYGIYGISGAWIDKLGSPPREIPETLKADDSEYPPPLSEEESYVKRGDRVVQLLDDD